MSYWQGQLAHKLFLFMLRQCNNLCLQSVQQRGAQVIAQRKLSSAMSAAKAICDHMRDWWFGTAPVSRSIEMLFELKFKSGFVR